MATTPRILLADDHALTRRGVADMLVDAMGPLTLGEAGRGAEVIQAIQAQPWDLLVLDLAMPDQHGLEVLRQVRALQPALRVLVFSMYPEQAYGQRLLKLGVAGYVGKGADPEEVVAAVKAVLAGGQYLSPALREHLAWLAANRRQTPAHEALTNREFQVFRLLALGRSREQVAAELGISVRTVAMHRGQVLRKLDLATDHDLTTYALRHRLIDGGEDPERLGLPRIVDATTQ